ncbi:MAG: hypothetical protein V4592_19680 [Bacteroidota bacterium]
MNPNPILQYFKKEQSHRIILLITCLFVAALGVIAFIVPPGIDPDPCWGFLVMHSMQLGNAFNLMLSPDPHNIAKDHFEFLAWWSPGQYMVPYFFISLFKVNTGKAVVLTIVTCNLLGLTGFYKLFTKLGFSKWLSAICIAFMASQLFFFTAFTYFAGGEVLLFAFLGWFLYGCFSIKQITWQALVFVFIGGLVGFFAKSSVLWMYAASVACIWVNVSLQQTLYNPKLQSQKQQPQKTIIAWLKNGLLLAIPFICAIAVIYICYLSKGDNPTSDQGPILIRPETFGYPLASPILSIFSVDELVHGLLYQTDGPSVPYNWAVIIMFICSVCCIVYSFFIGKLSPDKKYPIVIIWFYILGTLFFSYMYLKQATISYEGRHFRMIGILFLPGFVYLLFKTKITRVLFFMMWACYVYLAISGFKNDVHGNSISGRGPVSGLTQQLYSQDMLNELKRLDEAHHNDAVFVLTSSDIALEVIHNRVITIDDGTPDVEVARLKFAGKIAGPIYIITPTSYIKSGRLAIITKCLVDYPHFSTKQISHEYSLSISE